MAITPFRTSVYFGGIFVGHQQCSLKMELKTLVRYCQIQGTGNTWLLPECQSQEDGIQREQNKIRGMCSWHREHVGMCSEQRAGGVCTGEHNHINTAHQPDARHHLMKAMSVPGCHQTTEKERGSVGCTHVLKTKAGKSTKNRELKCALLGDSFTNQWLVCQPNGFLL